MLSGEPSRKVTRASQNHTVTSTTASLTTPTTASVSVTEAAVPTAAQLVNTIDQWKKHLACPACNATGTVHDYNHKKQKKFKCAAAGCKHKFTVEWLSTRVASLDLTVPAPVSALPAATSFLAPVQPTSVTSSLDAIVTSLSSLNGTSDMATVFPVIIKALVEVIKTLKEKESARPPFQFTAAPSATSAPPQARSSESLASPAAPRTASSPVNVAAPSPTTTPKTSWAQVVKTYSPTHRPLVQAALARMHNYNPSPPKTRTEKETGLRTVVARVAAPTVSDLRADLKTCNFRSNDILQTSAVGRNLFEFLVRDTYTNAFIKRLEEHNFVVFTAYDATKPLDKKASEEVQQRYTLRSQRRLATTIAHSTISATREFYTKMAAEAGWSSQVAQLVQEITAAKEAAKERDGNIAARVTPQPSSSGSTSTSLSPVVSQDIVSPTPRTMSPRATPYTPSTLPSQDMLADTTTPSPAESATGASVSPDGPSVETSWGDDMDDDTMAAELAARQQ